MSDEQEMDMKNRIIEWEDTFRGMQTKARELTGDYKMLSQTEISIISNNIEALNDEVWRLESFTAALNPFRVKTDQFLIYAKEIKNICRINYWNDLLVRATTNYDTALAFKAELNIQHQAFKSTRSCVKSYITSLITRKY